MIIKVLGEKRKENMRNGNVVKFVELQQPKCYLRGLDGTICQLPTSSVSLKFFLVFKE